MGLLILFLFLTDKIIFAPLLKKYCGRYTKVEICPDKIVMEYISEDGDKSNCYSKSGFKIIGNCNKDNCLSSTNICEK